MASKYPYQIDGSDELPLTTDNVTLVRAEVVNNLRSAILSIETELGTDPSREYGSVRDRLDALNAVLDTLTGSIGSPLGPVGGDLAGTLPNPAVIDLSIANQQQGSMLYFDGTNWVQLSPSTDGWVLTTHGTGANPTWTAANSLATDAPVNVTKSASNVGVSTAAARADHKHDITTDVPVNIGNANSEGTATTLSRSDHVHALAGTVGGDLSGSLPNPTVTGLSIANQVYGSVLYYNGSAWVQLNPGPDGYFLQTHSVGAPPTWASVGISTVNDYLSVSTWYVNNALGNDTNNGLTSVTALKTIEELNRRLCPNGDVAFLKQTTTVYVASGSYGSPYFNIGSGSLVIVCQVTSSANITLNVVTNTNASTSTRGEIETASGTFVDYARIRATTGSQVGAVAFSTGLNGLARKTFVTSFLNTAGAQANISVGDNVAIDTLTVSFDKATFLTTNNSATIYVYAGIFSDCYSSVSTFFNNCNFNTSYIYGGASFNICSFLNCNIGNGTYYGFGNQFIGNCISGFAQFNFISTNLFDDCNSFLGPNVNYSFVDIELVKRINTTGLILKGGSNVLISGYVWSGSGSFSGSGIQLNQGAYFSFGHLPAIAATHQITIAGVDFNWSQLPKSVGGTTAEYSTTYTSSANDLYYWTGTYWDRLPPGVDGYVLTTHNTSSAPTWEQPSVDLTIGGQTKGDILYFDGIKWTILHAGQDGYVLTAHDVGNNPTWSPVINKAVVIAAGAQTATSGTVNFSNANNITFGMTSNVMTASYSQSNQTQSNIQGITAGTAIARTGNIVFSNSNGVSFGLNGNTITASVLPGSLGINGIQAGTQTQTSGTLVFSNSNGVSFGINGSVLTASIVPGAAAGLGAVQAGGQTLTSGTLVFSNANGLTFGLNGSAITGSYTVPTVPSQTVQTQNNIQAISAGTTGANTGAVVFGNSNGISFGMNGNTITATVIPGAAAGIAAIQAGTQTQTSGTLSFVNANGITWGLSGSNQLTASVAGANSYVFTDGNNVSFGAVGSTITATATFSQSNQRLSFYALSNTIQGSSGTVDARSLSIRGAGNISVGYSNGSIVLSGNGSGGGGGGGNALAAGTQTAGTTGTILFSNSNGVSFGLNGTVITGSVLNQSYVFTDANNVLFGIAGSTITASANQTINFYGASNTVQGSSGTIDARSLTIRGAGNISVGYSNGSIVLSGNGSGGGGGGGGAVIAAGTQTGNTSGTVLFSNSNGVSFGLNGTVLTASVPNQSYVFNDANNVSFGIAGSTITATVQKNSISRLDNFFGKPITDTANFGNGSHLIMPINNGDNASFSMCNLYVSASIINTTNTHAGTLNASVGIYSRNGSTLSLASSGSRSFAYSNLSSNSNSVLTGIKLLSIPINVNMTGGDYWVVIGTNSSSAGNNLISWNNIALTSPAAVINGPIGSIAATTYGIPYGFGVFTATSASLRNSYAFSDINANVTGRAVHAFEFRNF